MTTTDKLIDMIRERHAAGLAKYGVTVDRKDLTPEQWLQHSIEERIDDLQYMMRAAETIAELRQSVEDWKRCATMLKAASEPWNCPEGGEAFLDLEKSAGILFATLSRTEDLADALVKIGAEKQGISHSEWWKEKPANVEGEMP